MTRVKEHHYLSFARISHVFAYSCQIELKFCVTELPAEEAINRKCVEKSKEEKSSIGTTIKV